MHALTIQLKTNQHPLWKKNSKIQPLSVTQRSSFKIEKFVPGSSAHQMKLKHYLTESSTTSEKEPLISILFDILRRRTTISLMAALTENMLTVNMLLSLFFLPGALANDCGKNIPALRITTPNNMEALTGSCLQIPCTYNPTDSTYDSSKTIYGIWMKGGVNYGNDRDKVIFDSSGSINIYSLNITGNLTEKNCTTLFPNLTTNHTDKYFFRVENGEYKASACADPLHITVRVGDAYFILTVNYGSGSIMMWDCLLQEELVPIIKLMAS
ncbi:uncharacterized protein LOC122824675 [Gambusia affinis]|uniref:uncharacterized protein LOC122824675 n=1 Tax=Gambusia affinis TaxID=33528 RepID=UPI001CDCB802|nr:uncharacterized protein LOC122824675 [Gambusia affinis]